jgi:predicted secreted protein
MARRDTSTLDLFRDVTPAPVVPRFAAEQVKAWTPARRLSRAIALTLDECGQSREEVAAALSAHLGERVSKATLDAYASPEKPHAISAQRLAALVVVTGDVRALNTLLNEAGLIVVPDKYEALLKREKARELKERAERDEQAADAEWRARR